MYSAEELSAALEDTITTLKAVSERVDQLNGHVGDLRRRFDQRDHDQKTEPTFWADRATPADWQQLSDWVDALQVRYGVLGDYDIDPCWPAHPGVVEELAGSTMPGATPRPQTDKPTGPAKTTNPAPPTSPPGATAGFGPPSLGSEPATTGSRTAATATNDQSSLRDSSTGLSSDLPERHLSVLDGANVSYEIRLLRTAASTRSERFRSP